jgi:D-arabinose 1-dehydrogenase-like Zn-dependent alcohol dehydrogenase
MKPIKLKTILNESLLGIMPSSKLMKMKWNPVTEADVFDTGATDGEDQSKVMDKLQKKFEGPLKSIIDLIKTKEDLNAAVSMLITKSEETTTGLGKRSKPVLLATIKAL